MFTVVPMLLSSMSLRSKTTRVYAKRRRLLDTSTVFVSTADLAEDGMMLKAKLDVSFEEHPPSITHLKRIPSHITPGQLRAIANLNALPQLHKELVWRPDCWTPHCALLGLKMFGKPSAERAGILRHWGDGLLH